jgi:hypothetical protein
MAIQQFEIENASYVLSNDDEDIPRFQAHQANMIVNENYRGAMGRSQPDVVRAWARNDSPNLSMNLGPDPMLDREDANGQLWHDDVGTWMGVVDVSKLNAGWVGIVDLKSNVAFNPNHETCFAQSVLGNYRAEYRHYAGSANLTQVLNQMPIQFERITQEVEKHFNSYLDGGNYDSIGLTVMQVLGVDSQENMVYGRIYQPEGASDHSSTLSWGSLSSKTLLAYPYANDVGVGDILVVPVQRWNGNGFILDAVNTTHGVPALRIAVDDDCWATIGRDNWRYRQDDGDDLRDLPTRIYGVPFRESHRRLGIEASGFLHYNKQEAHNYGIAMAILNEAVSLNTAGEAVEIEEYFIPAWKDKRGVKVIDRASPFPAHYHDEIRCSVCNGRVLIKLKGDNKSESADCPHCSRPKTILFPHLVSGKTDTLLTVGDTQRDDTHE